MVSGSQDGSVRVWDLRSGESLYGLYGYTPFLSSLHFDAHRLLSDGTNNGADPPRLRIALLCRPGPLQAFLTSVDGGCFGGFHSAGFPRLLR